MRLGEVLRNLSRIPEVHFKLGRYYLIAENEGRRIRCFIYDSIAYRHGGEPVEEALKKPRELREYLDELKRRYGVKRVRVIRWWT